MENLKEYFQNQFNKEHELKFNIFTALHDEKDETRLHSRFIAYLLNPTQHHGCGGSFLELFLKNVLKIDFDYRKYEVKVEYKNIDIFIYNDTDAIIIENKIYAGDSNHKEKFEEEVNVAKKIEEGYEGQLERYYHTITDGKDKNGLRIDYQRNVIQVAYLTLGGHKPTDDSVGKKMPKEKIKCIDYTQDIKDNWLTDCSLIAKNEPLSNAINQYKDLITKLTSDLQQARKNQEIISEYINYAWNIEKNEEHYFTRKISQIFNHVKWHTIADFFIEFEEAVKKQGFEIIEKPDSKDITKVAHNTGKSNKKLVIRFKINDVELYISNDINGFTFGNLNNGTWDYFSGKVEFDKSERHDVVIKEVKFNDFSKRDTFYIMSKEVRSSIILIMIEELVEKKFNQLSKNH